MWQLVVCLAHSLDQSWLVSAMELHTTTSGTPLFLIMLRNYVVISVMNCTSLHENYYIFIN